MNDPLALQFQGDIAIFRIAEASTMQPVVRLVTEAVVKVRELGYTRMLVDIGAIALREPPSLGTRHEMVRQWAEAAQGKVRGAMIAPPAFIDPHKFGVIAAQNFGLVADVFETEGEAMEWLRALPP